MLIKLQKADNINLKKDIRDYTNKNNDNIKNNNNNSIFPYNKYKKDITVQNNKNIKKNSKINKANTIEGNNYSKKIYENSYENCEIKDMYLNKKNKIKGKKNKDNELNNRSEENNQNSFNTKYDYILQKAKMSNGPVEIPADIDIQGNLNQKEWKNENNKINENVKRSDIIKKIKIFNNKKNNKECSNLLKKMKENEKKLIIFPYVKQKQKINKTIHSIGHSNGVTYLKTSLLSGGNENTIYNNFMNKIRNNEKKNKKVKKNMRINLLPRQYINKAEIDLNYNNINYY